jgi:hypothetical protein
MAPGPRFTVSPPPIAARPVGTLMTTLDPTTFAVDGNSSRWLNGVTFTPIGCDPLRRINNDCLPDSKTLDGFDDEVSFDAFVIYDGRECSTLSGQNIQGYVDIRLSAFLSQQLAAELMAGGARVYSGGSPRVNPSLSSAADVIGTTATSAMDGLYVIENALADVLNGGVGVIHVSPGMLTVLASGGGLQFINGRYQTPTGHFVIGDAGYVGTEPGEFEGDTAADEFWIYGSGLISWTTTEAMPVGTLQHERMDFTRNIDAVIAERAAIFTFDPCAVVATRVNVVGLSSDGSDDALLEE